MQTPKEFYQEIVNNKMDMEYINFILNRALRDKVVPSNSQAEYNYNYLCSVAKSFGFRFIDHWTLL